MPAASALLAAVALAAFWPVASGARNFFHLDLRYEHLPVWEVAQKALRAGGSPFWIAGEYCGQPLLFVQEAPLFYPPTVPLLLTGARVERLADLFSLFHFWLAGLSAFLLLADLDADDFSSLFGATAWMLSARLVQSAIWPNAVAVSALLPLGLLGIFRIARGQRRSGVAIAALSGGLALLAARPQTLLGAAPVLAAAVVATLLVARRRLLAAGALCLAAAIAVALGAASLVPTAALAPEMSQAAGLTRAERDVNPIGTAENLEQVFLPVDGAPRWPEAAAYPGLAAGLLFLAGLIVAVRRETPLARAAFLALAAGGLMGFLFAFGERGPYRYLAGLPLLRGFRVPARFLVSWSLAVALGSGLALAALLRRKPRAWPAAAAALLLLGVDLVGHARRAAPTAPAALASTEPEIVSRLRARLGLDAAGFPQRFWSLAPPINLAAVPDSEKVFVARSEEPLSGALGMRFGLESVSGGGPPLKAVENLFVPPSVRAVGLAGVGAVVTAGPPEAGTPPSSKRLEVEPVDALPRAILVPDALAIAPEAAIAATLASRFDPRRAAVVEGDVPVGGMPREPAGDVRLLLRKPSRLELSTSAPGVRILVLFDAYERGWTASVDGQPAEVLRADTAFRGVHIPAGRHRVVFQYRPPGLREGLLLSAAGLLGLVFFVIRAGREVLP